MSIEEQTRARTAKILSRTSFGMEKSEALAWSGSVPWCRCSSKGRGDGTDSREHGGRARYTARPPAGERALNTASTAEKACECMRDYLLRACAVSHGHGTHLQSPDFDENFVSANVGHAISHSSARPLADHMPFAPPVCTNIHTLSSCTSSLGLAGSQCPCTGCMHSCIGAVVQLKSATSHLQARAATWDWGWGAGPRTSSRVAWVR